MSEKKDYGFKEMGSGLVTATIGCAKFLKCLLVGAFILISGGLVLIVLWAINKKKENK